jgi:hypothetical protein
MSSGGFLSINWNDNDKKKLTYIVIINIADNLRGGVHRRVRAGRRLAAAEIARFAAQKRLAEEYSRDRAGPPMVNRFREARQGYSVNHRHTRRV